MSIGMLLSSTQSLGISHQNKIPWHNELDIKVENLRFFKNQTVGQTVIMDYQFWSNLDKTLLLKSINVVIDRDWQLNTQKANNLKIVPNFKEALRFRNSIIIGGVNTYNKALESGLVDYILWYCVNEEYKCDSFVDSGLFDGFYQTSTISFSKNTDKGNSIYLLQSENYNYLKDNIPIKKYTQLIAA